jgi:ribosomal protein S16
MNENEAMLKRLQSRAPTYNVTNMERERQNQVKLIKQICHYKPSISKRKKIYKRRFNNDNELRKDIERRYASAGPNK